MADIAAENFELLGISKMLPSYGIVKNDLINAPETMPNAFEYPTPGPTLLQSWYWAK